MKPPPWRAGQKRLPGRPEVAADRGGVEAGVDTGKENDEVLGGEIRDELVVRRRGVAALVGFPGSRQCPIS